MSQYYNPPYQQFSSDRQQMLDDAYLAFLYSQEFYQEDDNDILSLKLAKELEMQWKQEDEQERLSIAEAKRVEQQWAEQEKEKRRIEQLQAENASMQTVMEMQQQFQDEEISTQLAFQLNEQFLNDELSRNTIDELIAKEMQDQEDEVGRMEKGPGYWNQPLNGNHFQRIRLSPDSPLYTFVLQKFAPTGRKIQYIEYVQNETVWYAYLQSKYNNPSIPEVYRFHGTPFKNIDGISLQGFLTSKDISGGGTTIWSAEAPTTSLGYAGKGPGPDGTLYMFLAKVLSGMSSVSTVRDGTYMYPEFLIAFK